MRHTICILVENEFGVLSRIGNANAKKEFYLTDAVEIARAGGSRGAVVTCPEEEVLGVNSRDQLAGAEAIFQKRARLAVMREGATLIAPDTVWLSYDTKIGRDVVIEPNVFFGPGVTVEDGAEIKANCHIEKARVGQGARVGPFARLRPGADLGSDVHVGNFVEVKASRLGAGSKANHLAYIGDSEIGARVNYGAGAITCNYDGAAKNRTVIEDDVFIGSDTTLVAPVRIARGSYIGAGSTISKDTPAGHLRVNTTIGFGSIWLTSHLKEFMELYPDITVSLLVIDTELDLSMREADVAIRLTPPRQPDLV